MTLEGHQPPEPPARHPPWRFLVVFALLQLVAAAVSWSTRLEEGVSPLICATNGLLLAALLRQPTPWWTWSTAITFIAELSMGLVREGTPTLDVLVLSLSHSTSLPLLAWLVRLPSGLPIRSLQLATYTRLLAWLAITSCGASMMTWGWDAPWLEQPWRIAVARGTFADMLGAAIVTPLALGIFDPGFPTVKRETFTLETGLFLGSLAVLAALLTLSPDGTTWSVFGRPYLVLPFFLWGGLRLTLGAVALGQLIVAGAMLAVVLGGRSSFPYLPTTPEQTPVAVQVFLLTLSASALTLVVVRQEQVEEHHRLNQALRRLETTLLGAGAGTWDYNVETQQTIFSLAWRRQLGYEPHEIADSLDSFFALLHPDDHEPVRQYFQNYLESRASQPYHTEFRLRTRDGQYRWISSRAQFLPDARGPSKWLTGIHLDIHERKSLEQRIQDRLRFEELVSELGRRFLVAGSHDSEATLRRAIDEVGSYLRADRLGLIQFSEGMEACVFHHEYQADGVETTSYHPLAHPQGIPVESPCRWLAERTRSGEPVIFERLADLPAEAHMERAAFARRPVKAMAQFPLLSSHRVLGVLYVDSLDDAHHWDLDTLDRFGLLSHLISVAIERNRFEQELSSHAEFERAVSIISSRFANCPIDQVENEIEFALETMGRLSGVDRCFYFELSPDRELASNRYEWCAPGVPPAKHLEQNIPRTSYEKAFQWTLTGEPLQYRRVDEATDVDEDRRRHWQAMQVKSAVYVPLFVAGEYVGAIGQTTIYEYKTWSPERITMLKLVGEMLLAALERRRAALTLEDNREQLAAASRLAVMGEMVAGIAHEIRQPLHAMRNFAAASVHAMNGSEVPPLGEVRRWNERIMALVDRSDEIIRRYRDFCRPQKAEFTALWVDEIVTEAAQMLQGDLHSGKIQLDIDLPPHLPVLLGDRIQLEQVLVNVLKNACESMAATPVDKRRIEVRATVREGAARTVTLEIRDYGQGLSPDAVNRAFEPFWTSKPQGTGLGLAVCRTIIKDHGGRIWLEAASPGAKVHIEMPVEETRAP